MPRPLQDPSGPKPRLSIRLSPRVLAKLDRAAAALKLNRSTAIERFIDRAVKDDPS